jgi:rod shape-determining protein MreB
MAGGGALLRGLDQRLVHETGMPIVTAERPLQSVVLGSGAVLEEFDVLHVVLQSSGRV